MSPSGESHPQLGARAEIEAALPHRPPFLFVDEIVERTESGLAASWRVPPEADWFRGHYPGEPVLPGVILCEHAFQCAALFVAGRRGALAGGSSTAAPRGIPAGVGGSSTAMPSGIPVGVGGSSTAMPSGIPVGVGGSSTAMPSGIPVLTRILEARFRRIVRPGETLVTRVTLEEELGPALVFGARAAVGSAAAARLRFVLASTGELARAFAEEPG